MGARASGPTLAAAALEVRALTARRAAALPSPRERGSFPRELSSSRAVFGGLSTVYLWIGVGVAVLVSVSLIGIALRYRSREGEERPVSRTASRPQLELAYVLVLTLVAAGLLVITFHAEGRDDARAAHPAVRIHAIAAKWRWAFAYPGGHRQEGTDRRYPTLVVPAGEVVRLELSSLDVIHAFWLPSERVKYDAIPGRVARFDVRFAKPGFFPGAGECSEFCGLLHAQMRFDVRALPAATFAAWLARQGGPA